MENNEKEIAIYSGAFLRALGFFVDEAASAALSFNEETKVSKITKLEFTVSNAGQGPDEVFTLEVHPETGEGGVLLDR